MALKPSDGQALGVLNRRLHRLAENALRLYDLPNARLKHYTTTTNTIFQVISPNGKKYALRISLPGIRDLTQLRSEMAWLTALNRDTDLVLPVPVAARSGEMVVAAEGPHLSEPRYCSLFEWVEGRTVGNKGDTPAAIARKLGAVAAKLHNHAETFVPDVGFTTKRLDRTLFFGLPAAVYSDEPHEWFPAKRREILREAARRVQNRIDRLYKKPGGPLFLHADMHLGNVKNYHGKVCLLDFDDAIWCYPVQDLAICFYYLRRSEGGVPAFIEGYSQFRPWEASYDRLLETFIAARYLDLFSLDYLYNYPDASKFSLAKLQIVETRLEEWLNKDSGEIKKFL